MNKEIEMNRNIESILLEIDKTEDRRYLKRICELYYNEETPIEVLRSVFNERCAINQYLINDDVEGKDLDTLFFENRKGTFRKRWYNFDEAFQLWKTTIVYEDEYTTINKPSSFEESRNVGNPQWCFCYKNDKWLQHNQDFKETIYFVHCVTQPEIWQYNAVCVLPNNGMKILDSNHRYLSRNGEIDGYLHTLGKKAVSVMVSDKSIDESKNYKNMKKNVQRINESQLRAIVAESVKKVLKESHSMELEAALQDICRASSLIRNKTEYTQEEDYEPDYEIGYNDAAYLHKWASEIEEQASEWLRN